MTAVLETSSSELDTALEELHAAAPRWAHLGADEKAGLLLEVRATVHATARVWAEAGANAKGVARTPIAGEEWVAGPWATLYAINRYVATLREIARSGAPALPASRIRQRSDGQTVVDVFPGGLWDHVLLSGVKAEVWMEPGVTPATLASTMGIWYKETSHEPRVCLVLGAGNIAAIPPLDVLYKLVADGSVCLLKMNPVNAYLTPIFRTALAPLIREGYLRIVDGGAPTGAYLTNHASVDEIHITGSDRTHDAIIWGTDGQADERKSRKAPLLAKSITSELGNVSPTIVFPGKWSDADFDFQAQQIVTQKLHNDGFNCIALQVLVLPKAWDGTAKLLSAIDATMKRVPPRPGYYPGAQSRRDAAAAHHPDAIAYDEAENGIVPRTIIHVDAHETMDMAVCVEAFAPVIAVVELDGDFDTYVHTAVDYANNQLWGTLGANLVAHPTTMKTHHAAFDAAVAALRFGCVAINTWTGVGFLIAETTWGAYPGHTLENIGSGLGVVHNSHLFSRAQKTVIHASFAPFPRSLFGYGGALLPKPPWFVTHRNAEKIGQLLCDFEVSHNPLLAANIALLAMTG